MITIEHLIHYLGATDADDDVLLEMERNAVAFVETQTGRGFGPVVIAEEVHEGDGTKRLWLTDMPADPPEGDEFYDGVTVLVEGGALGSTPAEITGFVVRRKGRETVLIRTDGGVWATGYEYTVSGWKGYPAGEEPGDIRQLVLDLVSAKWQSRGKETLKSLTIDGGYSYTRFDASDLTFVGGQATIDAWRRLVYA